MVNAVLELFQLVLPFSALVRPLALETGSLGWSVHRGGSLSGLLVVLFCFIEALTGPQKRLNATHTRLHQPEPISTHTSTKDGRIPAEHRSALARGAPPASEQYPAPATDDARAGSQAGRAARTRSWRCCSCCCSW
jgi:hypothetical protein